jgi:hypothetical protein
MFLKTEERPAGEAQQVGKMKLSEAIQAGVDLVEEDRTWLGCALCAACYATGFPITPNSYSGGGSDAIYRHLEKCTSASRDLLSNISVRHYCGESTAQLIDWLAAQGL